MPVLSLHNAANYSSLPSGSASYSLGLSGQSGLGAAYSSAAAAAQAASNAALNNILSGGTASGIGAGGVGSAAGAYASLLAGASSLGGTGLGSTHPLSSTLNASMAGGLGGLGGSAYGGVGGYSTFTNPLLSGGLSSMNMKLKTYDDLDLLTRSYGAGCGRTGTTPSSPIPSAAWGLDVYGLDGVNPTFMHTHSRHGLDLDGEFDDGVWFVCLCVCVRLRISVGCPMS